MKILILTNLYPPQVVGGYERSIADFARLLHQRGHEIIVLTSDSPNLAVASSSSSNLGLSVQRCLELGGQWQVERGAEWYAPEQVAAANLNNNQTLDRYLQALQPDVCLAGNMDFLSTALLNQVLALSVPVVHYVMNSAPGYVPEETPTSRLYRYATCSDWVTRSLLEKGYPAQTAVTVYPGAAVQEFYQAELPSRNQLRIAYASLVMHYKGADVLVEALSLLNAVGIEFTATIAGGTLMPSYVQALQQFVVAEGMQDRVQFVGVLSRSELIELYKTHNVLAFPSRFEEPFGISQVEAMAAGVTLVTSGTGGAREIVEHGRDGLMFESENPLDLADALSSLPVDPERWETIARSGQQKALTQFSQDKAAAKLETVFQEMVQLRAAGSEAIDQVMPSDRQYAIGRFQILLPADHTLPHHQAVLQRYDTALGYISQVVFEKYPTSCAIDIGANVGDTAALMRNYVDVPILCVEGNPNFLGYLMHNAADIGNLEIEPCFAGNDGDTVACEQIKNLGGTATVIDAIGTDGEQIIKVSSLSTILEKYPHFQSAKLLKIDTDGFDFSIVRQSTSTLQLLKPVLYFEYETKYSQDADAEALEAVKVLFQVGYSYFILYDNFGNYLISLVGQDIERFVDLNICLAYARKQNSTPVIRYFDVCAFTGDDVDLFEQIRQIELALVQE